MAGVAAAAVVGTTAATAGVLIPANTITYSWNFQNNNGTVQTSGPSSIGFGSTTATKQDVGSSTTTNVAALNVTASAWNITKTNSTTYQVDTAVLGQYVGGLGITDRTIGSGSSATNNDNLPVANIYYDGEKYNNYDCGVGNCGTHQIDSQGSSFGSISTDVVQLAFDKAVVLGDVTRNSYGIIAGTTMIGGTTYRVLSYDNDFSFGNGMDAGLSAGTFSSSSFDAMWDAYRGTNGGCTVNSSGYCNQTTAAYTLANAQAGTTASKVWYISAGAALANQKGSDNIAADSVVDAFKLGNLTAYIFTGQMFVPEPSTWMMMVLGFGAVGASIRRRKAEDRAALAAA